MVNDFDRLNDVVVLDGNATIYSQGSTAEEGEKTMMFNFKNTKN